eukprot:m.45958 g.45958  ORF g.45958 m.45958 type:complete len:982 (-) comp10909_c0_seq1:3721-6666(-)
MSLESFNPVKAAEKLFALTQAVASGAFGEDVTSLVCTVSRNEPTEGYGKNSALIRWITCLPLGDIILVVSPNAVLFCCNDKKVGVLKVISMSGRDVVLKFLVRNKQDNDAANYKELLKVTGAKPALLSAKRSVQTTPFISLFMEQVLALEHVSGDEGISPLITVQDADELENTRRAAKLAAAAMHRGWRKKLVSILESEDPAPRHSEVTAGLEALIESGKFARKLSLDPMSAMTCYPPVVQSGETFSLNLSTQSNDDRIQTTGVVLCQLAMKFEGWCALVGRTIVIDPTADHEREYKILLELQAVLLGKLTPGAVLGEVYDACKDWVSQNHPALVAALPSHFGYATGLEVRNSLFRIQSGSTKVAEANMVFNIILGFHNIEHASRYSLLLADTVLVEGAKAQVLTADCSATWETQHFEFEPEAEAAEAAQPVRQREALLNDLARERRRTDHQRELAARLQEKIQRKANAATADDDDEEESKPNPVSYKRPEQFPRETARKQRIFVDAKHDTVILPIFGIATPFHISTIKSVTQTDEHYIRINFNTPGVSVAVPRSRQNMIYLRELVFRSDALASLKSAHSIISSTLTKYRQMERERLAAEALIEQDDLVLRNDGSQRILLRDLLMRPSTYKKVSGTLEAHLNGFRYHNRRNEVVDILYNNVRFSFFQPCKGETMILLHFTLKNPILIGKKAYKDVSFFTEIGEVTTDLNQRRHRSERDELMQEQLERKQRQKLTKSFKAFFKAVEANVQSIKFEIPYRHLAFQGVPGKSRVLIQPTDNCLVSLTEQPAFVLPMRDVERVHFERVGMRNREFDMVFVFSDYSKKVASISAIPSQKLDSLKNWLDACNIKFTEAPQPLNWNTIMKRINSNLQAFVEEGGWSFLEPEDLEDGSEDDEESDESSVHFSESELEDDASTTDSDYSDEVMDEESSEEADLGSDEEEGLEWDELEMQAAKKDRESAKRSAQDAAEEAPKRSKGRSKRR